MSTEIDWSHRCVCGVSFARPGSNYCQWCWDQLCKGIEQKRKAKARWQWLSGFFAVVGCAAASFALVALAVGWLDLSEFGESLLIFSAGMVCGVVLALLVVPNINPEEV